jgi:pSer/pThr/pTyr-binding forkhead associated (FHA) protein
MRFWLEYRQQQVELNAGSTVIGRSAECHLVLDDGLVSRRHAAVTVDGSHVVLEDLGSVNGVFLNEQRIREKRELSVGDRVVIGKQAMVLRAGSTAPRAELVGWRRTAETLHGVAAIPQANVTGLKTSSQPPNATPLDVATPLADEDRTTHGHAFELLSGVVDKILALGRGPEAERILGSYLKSFLTRAQQSGSADANAAATAAAYATKLAAATGKGGWVDYAIELYAVLKRPLPAETVDELYSVVRGVSTVNLAALQEYVEVLRAESGRLGPSERFVVQRIEGLARIVALK